MAPLNRLGAIADKARETHYALEVRELTVSYSTADGDLQAVDKLSLKLRAGERWGLVGES